MSEVQKMNADWKTVALGELVEHVQTWNPSRSRAEDIFDYIDLSAVDQETKIVTEAREVNCGDAPSRARQLVVRGDVLVSTVRPNLNGVARVPDNLDGATASTGFCVLRPRESMLASNYLFHWVKSPVFIADMVNKATGASYPAVSDRIILDSCIPLPPLVEQLRIGSVLDRAEEIRTKRRAAVAQTDSLPQSLFFHLFGDPMQNERGWQLVKVGDAGRVQLGRQRAPQYQSGMHTHPYIRVANVYEDQLDLSDVLSMDFDTEDFEAYRLEYGDILLNEGQSTELVGRPAIWRNEIPDCCFQNTLVRFQPNPKTTVPEFALAVFLRYLRSGEFAKVSSKTSNVAHLGAGRFAAMPFPVPPMALQREFSSRVTVIEKLKSLQLAALVEVNALISSLQHRAFRGEL
jgi:type I restriction enzyme S subunit